MTRPNAIAFDLDGTLAESKQPVSPDMGLLLARLLHIMPVAIISGAGFKQFQIQFLSALPEHANFNNLYFFPTNAAQCYVYRDAQWVPQYDHSFSEKESAQILQALMESLAEVGLTDPPEQTWGERIENRGSQISFSPLGQQAPVDDKQRWHDAHDEVRKKLRDLLASKLPEYAVATGGLTTVDITRKGLTKAYGIERFAEFVHAPISSMLFVGDALEEGGNDSVVIDTGIPTHGVFGPPETAALIETVLSAPAPESAKNLS